MPSVFVGRPVASALESQVSTGFNLEMVVVKPESLSLLQPLSAHAQPEIKKKSKGKKKKYDSVYSHCSIISVYPLWFVAFNYVSRALMVIFFNNNTIKLNFIVLLTNLCFLNFKFPAKFLGQNKYAFFVTSWNKWH